MAKAYDVELNKPMLDALRRLILRDQEICPCCQQTLDYHSRLRLNDKGRIIDCSNVRKE